MCMYSIHHVMLEPSSPVLLDAMMNPLQLHKQQTVLLKVLFTAAYTLTAAHQLQVMSAPCKHA